MKITVNYKLIDLKCKDGTLVPEQFANNAIIVASQIEVLNKEFREVAGISSAYRTKRHNRIEGGAKKSKHLTASASDFYYENADLLEVEKYLVYCMRNGLIIPGGYKRYNSFIHYDIRGYIQSW
jgi:uncharacterized protein YcbK (DUF882 family)